MPDIEAHTPDGVVHSFPDGTPDAVIDKVIKGYLSDSLTKQTQAAAPKTSTKPFFERPPEGTPFPSSNPIEKKGQQLDVLNERENRAMRSPTPFTDATSVIMPTAGATEAAEKFGVKAAAKGVARTAAKSGIGAFTGREVGRRVGGETGAEIGTVVGGAAGAFGSDRALSKVPFVGESLFSEEELADMKASEKLAQRKADEKAGLRKPVPPPPDPNYEIGKAQVQAQEENIKRTSAAYNKDAEERMAIQKRADDAEAQRMQAEKEAKNARFKAEQTHAKELAEAEKARQAEITAQARVRQVQGQMDRAQAAKDAKQVASLQGQIKQAEAEANAAAAQTERLRNEHAESLMARQKEQDALDKAAEKARGAESGAKAKVQRLPPERPSGSGRRPTASEQFLTNLTKKPLISLDDDAQGRRYFGKDWELRQGEGHQGRVSRLLGTIRAGRSAQGMRDTSIGPMAAPPAP
jgi:predicted  nucleic acid-binding Zn-ribbon protein